MCIISGILSALGDGEFFVGCKFDCGVAQYFALAVFVISLSLAARERENNLFGVNNIYKLTRLKSRKTALLIEILRLTLWDTAATAVWCTAIYITERLNKNAIDTDIILRFFVFDNKFIYAQSNDCRNNFFKQNVFCRFKHCIFCTACGGRQTF